MYVTYTSDTGMLLSIEKYYLQTNKFDVPKLCVHESFWLSLVGVKPATNQILKV